MITNTDSEIMKVIDVRPETCDITTIILGGKPDTGLMNSLPGQYVSVSLRDHDLWTKGHPFTITNTFEKERIQLTIKRVGAFTGSIHSLRPGDEVMVKGPLGTFCSALNYSKPIVMIAGGIGITPFLSVLRGYYKKSPGLINTKLFWCNPTPEGFFCLPEIESYYFFMEYSAVIVSESAFLPKHLKKFRLSRMKFETGLLSVEVLKRNADFRDADIFVCGSGTMQDYMLKQLEQCGVTNERIKTEMFGV